jgi:peptidoglycan/LPS O-acetylase OafA/YrhL
LPEPPGAARSPGSPALIAPLTGLRAFAAVWVVCHHLRPAPPGWSGFFDLGYLGVDLFGFLSGFVMTYLYAELLASPGAAEKARFLWRRAVRIFPLHWFALALLVVARFAIPEFGTRPSDSGLYGAGDLVQQILMVHGWGLASRFAWNIPSWTVSSEWLAYLAFPFVAPLIASARDARRCALLAVLSFGTTALLLTLVGRRDFNAALDWGWLRIGGEFLTGCWLQRAWSIGFARRVPWGLIGPAALLAAIGFGWLEAPAGVVACFGVLVLALAYQRGPLARLLSLRPIVFLGDASYAIYLMHWVVLRVLLSTHLAPIPLAGRSTSFTTVAIDLACVLVVAIAAHIGFDVPVRRRLHDLLRPA